MGWKYIPSDLTHSAYQHNMAAVKSYKSKSPQQRAHDNAKRALYAYVSPDTVERIMKDVIVGKKGIHDAEEYLNAVYVSLHPNKKPPITHGMIVEYLKTYKPMSGG